MRARDGTPTRKGPMTSTSEFSYRSTTIRGATAHASGGFPYLVTRICSGFHHVIPLPRLPLDDLCERAARQHDANRLPTCLAIAWDNAVGFGADSACTLLETVPFASFTLCDRLQAAVTDVDDAELEERRGLLRRFSEEVGYVVAAGRFVLADRLDILREPSAEEIGRLSGHDVDSVPVGLDLCAQCGKYRGECLDTVAEYQGLVARVRCLCENDTRCAGCGALFSSERLDSGSYNEDDGMVWHIPAFPALSHRCGKPRVPLTLEIP